jgi:hypothetical protein
MKSLSKYIVLILNKCDRLSHEWEEEECIYDIGGKARRKETSRMTKT